MRAVTSTSGGFTLVEVLVVVAIIAVLSAGGAWLARPNEAQLAEREAGRLAALLELALLEARASGRPIAWQPGPRGYAFSRRDEDGDWTPFPDDSVLRARTLPDATQLKAERATLLPYGLAGPLEARIAGGGREIILRGGGIGRVALERL